MYFIFIERNKTFPKYAYNLQTLFFPSLSPAPTYFTAEKTFARFSGCLLSSFSQIAP